MYRIFAFELIYQGFGCPYPELDNDKSVILGVSNINSVPKEIIDFCNTKYGLHFFYKKDKNEYIEELNNAAYMVIKSKWVEYYRQ